MAVSVLSRFAVEGKVAIVTGGGDGGKAAALPVSTCRRPEPQ